MSEKHPIEGLMTTAMESLKDMVDVNTIIGDPIESPDGSVIITVSKVGFGFAAGGSEFNGSGGSGQKDNQDGGQSQMLPFGGGSGGGVSITPTAFLIVNSKGVQMIHLDENTHLYEKMLDLAPQAFEKIQEILKNSKDEGNKGKSKDDDKKKEEDKDKSSDDE